MNFEPKNIFVTPPAHVNPSSFNDEHHLQHGHLKLIQSPQENQRPRSHQKAVNALTALTPCEPNNSKQAESIADSLLVAVKESDCHEMYCESLAVFFMTTSTLRFPPFIQNIYFASEKRQRQKSRS